MADSFNIGDVVRLKSGGPLMTVESLAKDQNDKPVIFCCWFDGTTKKTGIFPPGTLAVED